MKRDAIQMLGLPTPEGKLEPYQVREPKSFMQPSKAFTRRALAEAMDAAQRGMGLDWPNSLSLIKATDAAGLLCDPGLACRRMKQLLAVRGCG